MIGIESVIGTQKPGNFHYEHDILVCIPVLGMGIVSKSIMVYLVFVCLIVYR
jgi:hypothetical protein